MKNKEYWLYKIVKSKIQKDRQELNEWAYIQDKCYKVPKNLEMIKDIPYLHSEDNYHTIDIFRPKEQQFDLPVIINIHGGGLLMGNKSQNKGFNIWLSMQGFLVYSIEYSLVPDVKVQDQLNEINKAFEVIKNRIHFDGGDINKVALVGDSAGAFLALYSTAIKNNKNIANSFNIDPVNLNFKALVLQSGMFYTTKLDKVGFFLRHTLYGKNYKKQAFAKYLNPENEEFLKSLPSIYLMTSQNDHLKHYTLNFAKALDKEKNEYELVCYSKNKNRVHAFSALYPHLDESIEANKAIVNYLKRKLMV